MDLVAQPIFIMSPITPKRKTYNFKSRAGFTLIELVIVFSVIAILSIIGIASFVSYSHSQTLNTATLDVSTMLNTAKSKALSQVKPAQGSCSAQPLDGYKVIVSRLDGTYEINAICGGNIVLIERKTLPTDIGFGTVSATTIFFHGLTGSIDGAGTITITGYSMTKSIDISPLGNIYVH